MGLIRLLLALGVVTLHSNRPILGDWFVYGRDAVHAFFVISGFYMSLILNGKYSSYSTFISNRFLKVFPAYLAIVLIAFFVTSSPFTYYAQGQLTLASLLFLLFANVGVFGSQLVPILQIADDGGLRWASIGSSDISIWKHLLIGPVWSLDIELCFYLIAPFLVKKSRLYPWIFISCVLFNFWWRHFLTTNNAIDSPWDYNLFPSALIYFMLGSLGFRFYELVKLRLASKTTKIFGWASFAILVSLCIGYDWLPPILDYINSPISRKTLLVGCMTLLSPFVFIIFKKSEVDRFIGDLSYPVYVSHYLFTNYLTGFVFWHPILPTLIVSLLLTMLIVRPINRIRERRAIAS